MLRRLLISTIFFFIMTAGGPAAGEFFKYTDEKGRIHYVDDMSRIPEGSEGRLETYLERYDDLPAAERERVRAEQEIADAEKERASQRQLLRILDQAKKDREAYLTEKRSPENETPFVLKNNQVLVPVKIGYGGREVETRLLLDTGAGMTALHSRAIGRMNVQGLTKAKARTAGGQIIDTRLATVDYIQVGPHRIDGFTAAIIDFEGAAADHDGLLGMDFLGRFPYGIDMTAHVIRWAVR